MYRLFYYAQCLSSRGVGTGPKLSGSSKQVELAHGRGEVVGSLPARADCEQHIHAPKSKTLDCSDAIGDATAPFHCHQGRQPTHDHNCITTASDLGPLGVLWRLTTATIAKSREKRDKSTIVTRAASKALDKTDSPTALGKRAGDALKE